MNTDQLIAYTKIALAAGVSTLAMAQPSQSSASVVITNTSIPITNNHPLLLDINGDGQTDITFSMMLEEGHSVLSTIMNVIPSPGNAIMEGKVGGPGYASALIRGAAISSQAQFGTSNGQSLLMEKASCVYSDKCHVHGNWVGNHPNRFIGIRFLINGQAHYGWARVSVRFDYDDEVIKTTLTEYGYEQDAGVGVLAGETVDTDRKNELVEIGPARPILGMLAAGVDGLAMWRREDRISKEK
jgi:hypothetical protein